MNFKRQIYTEFYLNMKHYHDNKKQTLCTNLYNLINNIYLFTLKYFMRNVNGQNKKPNFFKQLL